MKNLKFLLLTALLACGFSNVLMAQIDPNPNNVPNKVTAGNELTNLGIMSYPSWEYKAVFYNGDIKIYYRKYSDPMTNDWSMKFNYRVGGTKLKIQDDGNMVAYDNAGNAVWATGTNGRGGSGTHLQIQKDGNLVLYNGSWLGGDGDAIWATGTCGGQENGCGGVGVR